MLRYHTEEDEWKIKFLRNAKHVFFSVQNVLYSLLSVYMYFFIREVLLKHQKMVNLSQIKMIK